MGVDSYDCHIPVDSQLTICKSAGLPEACAVSDFTSVFDVVDGFAAADLSFTDMDFVDGDILQHMSVASAAPQLTPA